MEAGVRTIRDLLSPNEQYVIPFFQRSYAWKKKERELLWEDIIRLCDDKSHKLTHFLGPVVSSSSGNQVPGSTRSYLLIDGQQRLTTLTIFLIAIRDVALEREDDELAETILEDYLINKRAKGNQQYKLLPRYHDAAALISLVRGENQSAHKSKEIYKAWRDAKKWAHQFSDDDTTSLKELFISITDRLSLVVISIDKEDPYEIFEGLNNRGQALQESDLIRNFVFMQVPLEEQQQFNDEYWKRFEDTFDVEKTSSQKQSVFFRHYLMIDGDYSPAKSTFSSFRKKSEATEADITEQVKEIISIAQLDRLIRIPSEITDSDIRELISEIHSLGIIDTSRSFLLHLLRLWTSNSIDKAKLQSCLSDFSSFVLRRSLCGLTTRQYDRWFPAAVNAIHEDLVDDLREYWSSRGWPGDEWIVERMHYLPLYKSNKSLVKLILGRIEESYGHKERINLDDLTIEHIMPQTTTSEWERDLGSGWFEKHQKWLHTIGNLTLTGYNSEMQNKAFVTKRNLYLKQSNLKLNLYFDDLNCWNDETISERGKKLSEMVIKIWENPIGSKGFDFDLDSGIEDIKSPTNTIRQFAINRIGKSLNLSLVELTTARFRDDLSDTEILCTVSRQYDNSGDSKGFWFGLNPSQIADLESVTNGYVAFTCATPEIIFLVPISVLTPLLKSMNVTMEEGEPNSVRHWHCFIEFRNKQYFLLLSKEKTQLSLDQFSV